MAKRKKSATVDLKLRMKEPLRARIERSARERGISMNSDAVDRLERSFERAELVAGMLGEALELAYGRGLAAILVVLGEAMKVVGPMAYFKATNDFERPQDWRQHPVAFAHATEAAKAVLEALKPPGAATAEQFEDVFRGFVNAILEEAATGHTRTSGTVERARRMHGLLGPDAELVRDFADPAFRDAASHIGDDR